MLRLSVDDDSHDSILEFYIDGATLQVELDTSLGLIEQTWLFYRDSFPDVNYLQLPIGNITEVVSITYTGGSVSGTDYSIDVGRNQLKLNSDVSWPTGTDINVAVEFKVGFGTTAASVPQQLRQAVAMQVGKWFNNPTLDMSEAMSNGDAAYERLIARYLRSDYP